MSWDAHLNTWSENLTEPLVFLQKYDTILQNISSKQYIIYFLIHTQYTPAKFGDNPSLIILENLY